VSNAKTNEAKKIKTAQADAEKRLAKAKKQLDEAAKKASLELWPKLTDLPKVGSVAAGGKMSADQAKAIHEPAKRRSKARKAALANPELRKLRKEFKRAQREKSKLSRLLNARTAKKADAAQAAEAPAAS
jgi:hypothetical protein